MITRSISSPIGPAYGLGSTFTPTWSPRQLGAAWVMDPNLFTLSSSNITAAADAGGSTNVLAALSGKEPVVDTGGCFGVSHPCLRTSNTSTRLFSATGGVTGNSAWSLISIFEMQGAGTGPASVGDFALFGTPASARNAGLGASSTSFACMGNGVGTFQVPNGSPYFDSLPHIIEARYNGTSLNLYFDGALLGGPFTVAANITDAAIGFGNWYTQPTYPPIDARVHTMAFFAGANPSQSDVTTFLRYEMTRLASPAGRGRIVAMFGDSTTQGTASGAEALDKSLRLQQVFPNVIFPSNYGISGERADQIATRLAAFSLASTHIVIWCGRNMPTSVTPAADAATTYASITTMVQRAHAMGSKAVVGTLDQWGAATVGSYANNYRIALNVLILANSAGADAIALIDEAMGAYNIVNFCADTLHENIAAERTIVAPAIYAALLTC